MISETGVWLVRTAHRTDQGLLNELVEIFGGQNDSFYDFGCGDASYARALYNTGVSVECYDGNPKTPEITDGLGKILDLTSDFDLPLREWVICLEVGEHVPKHYETKLLDNICKHASTGVIMSWAVPFQKGHGHINCQSNEHIREQMADRGFSPYAQLEDRLRSVITRQCDYFSRTLMAFIKDKE